MWIFQHIPKCAGTTITHLLLNELLPEEDSCCMFQGMNPNKHFQSLIHQQPTSSILMGHVLFGIHNLINEECRYITVLRQPVLRVISQFYAQYSWKKEIVGTHDGVKDFEEFVQGKKSILGNNLMTRMICGWPNDLQRNFAANCVPCTERMFESACQNIDNWYDLIGFQEYLDPFVSKLVQLFGGVSPLEIPVINQTVADGIISPNLLPENVIDLVLQANQFDVRLYNYCLERREYE
jgi:hypothetical protein